MNVASLDRVPVMRKDELVELQAAAPFAGSRGAGTSTSAYLPVAGPLYKAEQRVPDPSRWAPAPAPALRAAGFGEEDVVLNASATTSRRRASATSACRRWPVATWA